MEPSELTREELQHMYEVLERRYQALDKEFKELIRMQESIKRAIDEDYLTGVKSRRYIQEALGAEIERAERSNSPLSLVIADIDYFKEVNDRYGHQVGDRVLRELAQILQSSIRRVDAVGRCREEIGRYGGEEFLILLPTTPKEGAVVACQRLRKIVADTKFDHINPEIKITMSFGIASYPEDANNIEELMRKADKALYKAKGTGRNTICAYKEGDEE